MCSKGPLSEPRFDWHFNLDSGCSRSVDCELVLAVAGGAGAMDGAWTTGGGMLGSSGGARPSA